MPQTSPDPRARRPSQLTPIGNVELPQKQQSSSVKSNRPPSVLNSRTATPLRDSVRSMGSIAGASPEKRSKKVTTAPPAAFEKVDKSSQKTLRSALKKSKMEFRLNNSGETGDRGASTHSEYFDVLSHQEPADLSDEVLKRIGEDWDSLKSGRKSKFNTADSIMSMLSLPNGGLSEGGTGPKSWRLMWKMERGKQGGEVKNVRDVRVLKNGNIAAAEAGNSRIQLIDPFGKTRALLGDSSPDSQTAQSFTDVMHARRIEPSGLCQLRGDVEGDILMVTDHRQLLMIDTSTPGRLIGQTSVKNKTDLYGIDVTTDRKLVLSDLGRQPTVGLYNYEGQLVRELGPRSQFRRPAYVSWGEEYSVLAVSDSEQHSIYLYDASGKPLTSFGPSSSGSSHGLAAAGCSLIYPCGLCWLPQCRLMVADKSASSLLLYDLRNMTVERVLDESDGLLQPVALASNRRNRVIVSEEFYDSGNIDRYSLKLFKYDFVKTKRIQEE